MIENQPQFGRTSLTASTTSSTSSSIINGTNIINSHLNISKTNSDKTFNLDNGFSIYNKNIDFYESFTASAAKDVKSSDDVKMKQGQEENSLILVSNNINNNNNHTKIINNNTINSSSSNQKYQHPTTNNFKLSCPDISSDNQTSLISDLNNLHNYSKSPNAIENKPNSVQNKSHHDKKITNNVKVELEKSFHHNDMDDDDDEDDDVHMKSEDNGGGLDDKLPDHHARRPMNAFLIFCKRHRSIVRDRHPNLENRSITKILGDWWANLDKDEKQCFTELARMYKDAFFSANPNFKWYKLPAPPLRTLSSVKSGQGDSPNKEYSFEYPANDENGTVESKDWFSDYILDSPPSNGEKLPTKSPKKANSVGTFKLADETQMGGLSSLLTNSSDNSVQNDEGTQDKDQSLQDALSETSSFIVEKISSSRTEPFTSMRNKSKEVSSDAHLTENDTARKWKLSGQNYEPSSSLYIDDDFGHNNNKKSSRSCKGKRYQEIMKSIAKVGSPSKRMKVKHVTVAHNKQNGFDKHKHDDSTNVHFDAKEGCSGIVDGSDPFDKSKMFDASDFDLEEKIKALPALNLDEYLARKRETKKTKKKIGGRSKMSKTAKNDVKNKKKQDQNNVSGSQKRKAPKETITRRDVSASVQEETKIINIPAITSTTAGTSAADLFTLAEVAVQTASIDAPTL
uniref:CSON012288 protein n=1 Tax=Culicoides sonorensis TaxID=179676 RepID=A0A336K7M1_CULSO